MRNQSESVWHSLVVSAVVGTSGLVGGCHTDTTNEAAGASSSAPSQAQDTTTAGVSASSDRAPTANGSPAASGATDSGGATVSEEPGASDSDSATHGAGLGSGEGADAALGSSSSDLAVDAALGPGLAADAGGAGDPTGGLPPCPVGLLEVFVHGEDACADEGFECQVPMACTGGPEPLILTCKDGSWQQGPRGCEHPYEFCHQASYTGPGGAFADPPVICVEGNWEVDAWTVGLADGVGDCPKEAPPDGADCVIGGTGGVDQSHCGYPCSGGGGVWTVVDCVAVQGASPIDPGGTWSHDHACD